MKNVSGGNFGVRFFRRGVTKDGLAPQKMDAVNAMDHPEKKPDSSAMQKNLEQARKLHAAAKAGDCYSIRVLVMEGADLEARDEQGRTALNIATQYNQKGAIKTLLAAREMRRMASRGELPDTTFFKKFKPGRTA